MHHELVLLCKASRGRPRQRAEDYADDLDVLTLFAPLSSVQAGVVYGFPETIDVPDSVASVTAENAELLAGGLDEWMSDAHAGVPLTAVLQAGRAVALCASVQAAGGFHFAGVETVGHLRGHGFGTRAVRAWARMVRSLNAEPFYATPFDNIASQAVARSFALRLIYSEFSVECCHNGADRHAHRAR